MIFLKFKVFRMKQGNKIVHRNESLYILYLDDVGGYRKKRRVKNIHYISRKVPKGRVVFNNA
ncbi:hypothetical protein GPICK_10410 [Geobacter pickeringii]|uniref:Uncharacterized protein n=1 Tax=Geobacter pickeringii TaxID=345632 RepID=A0A0B5BEY5_9BACT|nr:hypothetical protein GPICK_10410 [Geobacter pickeringii]